MIDLYFDLASTDEMLIDQINNTHAHTYIHVRAHTHTNTHTPSGSIYLIHSEKEVVSDNVRLL